MKGEEVVLQMGAVKRIDPLVEFGVILLALKTSVAYSNIIYYPEFIDRTVTILASIVLASSIIRHRYTVKSIILFAIIGSLTLYSAICSGDYGLLITVLTCIAAFREDFNTVIRKIYKTEMAFFLIHTIAAVLLGMVGVINIRVTNSYGQFRYSFGFNHANTFSIYFLNLVMMWIWLNYFQKKNKKIYLAIIAFLTFSVYLFTRTRTLLLSAVVLFLLLLITDKLGRESKFLAQCAKSIGPLCCVIVLTLCITFSNQLVTSYKSAIVIAIDHLLSSRIRLGAYGYTNYGITIFGQDVSNYRVVWDQNWGLTSHTFDDVYTYCAMNAGFIWLIIIFSMFYILVKKSHGENRINVFILLWALYGITEVHVLNGYVFFPVLMIMMAFSPNSKEKGLPLYKHINRLEV